MLFENLVEILRILMSNVEIGFQIPKMYKSQISLKPFDFVKHI